jgi:ribosomal-protein-serine acetyltransferase
MVECLMEEEMLETTLKDDITIKMLEMRQSHEMYDFIVRNKDFFIDWIPFVSQIHSLHDIERLMKKNLERYIQGLGLYYTLWENNTLIGYVLAREIDKEAKWAEIGYMVDEQYTGRGIMKESCIRLINYLFDDVNMDKIVICCTDDNEKSKALAIKLGFTLEGNIRNHFVVNNKIRNMLYYGLLKEEYTR